MADTPETLLPDDARDVTPGPASATDGTVVIARRPYRLGRREGFVQETRRRVLDAARELFAERGVQHVSVEDVAKRATVARATVYYQFKTKIGLVSEVLEDAIEQAGASRLREARAEADARESITHWLTTLCEFWAADFELFANIISVAPTDPEIRAITDAYDYRRREALREMAGRLEEQGYLRAGVTPDHAGDVLWVLSSLAAFDHLYRRSNMTVPEVAQTIMDMTAHLLADG